MKIALIGASGFVGSALLNEAIARGYNVTAIARNVDKIKSEDKLVSKQKVDVFDIDLLVSVLKGHDAVVSAYNACWDNPNLYEDFIKGSEAIQSATKKAGVKRLLVVGGAGSLEIAPGVQLVDTPEFPAEYKEGATAARDYLNILKKETELDWTFLSPAIQMHPGITDGRTGKYRTALDNPVFDANNESRLSVEDLSVALLDELEQGRFIKKRFTAAY